MAIKSNLSENVVNLQTHMHDEMIKKHYVQGQTDRSVILYLLLQGGCAVIQTLKCSGHTMLIRDLNLRENTTNMAKYMQTQNTCKAGVVRKVVLRELQMNCWYVVW